MSKCSQLRIILNACRPVEHQLGNAVLDFLHSKVTAQWSFKAQKPPLPVLVCLGSHIVYT